jgi:hypothetical protein
VNVYTGNILVSTGTTDTSGDYGFQGYQYTSYTFQLVDPWIPWTGNFSGSGQTAYQYSIFAINNPFTPHGNVESTINCTGSSYESPTGVGYFQVNYNDTSNGTTLLVLNVYQQYSNGSTSPPILNQNYTNLGSASYNFTIPSAAGNNYIVNATVTSTQYGTFIANTWTVYYYGAKIVIPILGPMNSVYPWLCLFLGIVVLGFFSIKDAHLGLLCAMVVEWFCYWAVWLPQVNGSYANTGALLGILTILAILEIIRYAANKVFI